MLALTERRFRSDVHLQILSHGPDVLVVLEVDVALNLIVERLNFAEVQHVQNERQGKVRKPDETRLLLFDELLRDSVGLLQSDF